MPDSGGNFIWYELLTPAVDAARAFYGKVVGWKIADPGPEGYWHVEAPDGDMVGGMMQLSAEMQQHGARPMWLAYLNVDDVDAAVSAIEQGGGKALMPARDMENVGRFAMVADPQGAPFYAMKPTPPPDRPDAKSTAFSQAPGHCGWNELATSDEAGAIDFYAKLFGWSLPEPMDIGAMGKYQFIAKGEHTYGAIMRRQNEGQPVAWLFYFGVPSIAAAKTAIEAAGGKVWMGPMEVPGGQWIVVASDPQDAPFGLIGPKGE